MKINTVLRQLQQSRYIAVIAHIQPDGDTIGSCLALAEFLEAEGKKITLYCQDKVPSPLEFLNGYDKFRNSEEEVTAYDLSIAVDCSDIDRLGNCYEIFKAGKHTINIDHHKSNTLFADINLVDTNAAATGEIIYRIGRELTGHINKYAAEALYTAISTDTGSFCYGNTTSNSYRIAAQLVDYGVDIERITTILYKRNRLERIRLLGRALNSLALYENNTIAIMAITREDLAATGAMESEIESMVNYAINIIGVEIGILLKEAEDGTIRISFRSKGRIDVSKLAGCFGGGGHHAAAGASMSVDIYQARKQILKAAHEILGAMKQ
ncbi:MAG: DHH family phosphoesterase [Caldicoprobacterales bacterium]|jgi:phosphoesterase RecJ-like protein